jgi:hypothetical protein
MDLSAMIRVMGVAEFIWASIEKSVVWLYVNSRERMALLVPNIVGGSMGVAREGAGVGF